MNKVGIDIPIVFSTDELWFLMNQFSSVYVIGMENPHLGWLIEEIEEANRTAVQGLMEKGVVKIVEEGKIDLDDSVASLILACTHPEHSLIVNGGNDKDDPGLTRYIHFVDGLIVEHVKIKSDQHQLSILQDRDEILARLHENLRSDTNTKGTKASFFIAEEILYNATSLYSLGKPEKGRTLLQESDLEPACANALAKTLSNPVANASFVAICNQNDPNIQRVSGFGILEGEDQFWIMKPIERAGKRVVEFTPASSKSVRRQFIELLP